MEKITITNAFRIHRMERHSGLFDVVAEGTDEMEASDGYHTFAELYDHRVTLFIALCKEIDFTNKSYSFDRRQIWRSKKHSDGEICFGTGTQFVLGIGYGRGDQVTYHILIERWDECKFAETLEKAPEFDGHTSDDVLERLKTL